MKKIFTALIFSICSFSYINNDLIIQKNIGSTILNDVKNEKTNLWILGDENLYNLKLNTNIVYKKTENSKKSEDKSFNLVKYITDFMIDMNKKTAYEVEKNKLEKEFVNYLTDLKNNELVGNKLLTNNSLNNSKIYLELSNKENNYSKYNIYDALDNYIYKKIGNIVNNNENKVKYIYIEKNYNFDKIELGITNRKSVLGEEIKYNINSKFYLKPSI